MAKTFGQNCAKHSSAVTNRAEPHLTFAGRANEKWAKRGGVVYVAVEEVKISKRERQLKQHQPSQTAPQ